MPMGVRISGLCKKYFMRFWEHPKRCCVFFRVKVAFLWGLSEDSGVSAVWVGTLFWLMPIFCIDS